MTQIPFVTPGVPEANYEAFTQHELLLGQAPALFEDAGRAYTLAESTTLAIYSVVGFDSDGNIAPAIRGSVDPADDIAPIGITTHSITSGVGENPAVMLYRGGNFNGDALEWPASFSTDAHKLAAFEGAPSPTQIVIGFNKFNRKS